MIGNMNNPNGLSLPKTKNVKQVDENATSTECFTAETLLLTSSGSLLLLEELAGEYDSSIEVMSIDNYGRITTTKAYNFRVTNWLKQLYSVTLSNGLKIKASPEQKILTANNGWTAMKDLTFGTALKTATYDPRTPTPTLSIDEIVHARIEEFEEPKPMFGFTLKNQNNLFIGDQIGEKIMLTVSYVNPDNENNNS